MTLKKVIKILADYADLDESKLTAETTFAELGLDSLDTVELVMNLEDEFKISLELGEGVETIGDVVKLIEAAVA